MKENVFNEGNKSKEDRQCTYNAALKLVRVTILAVEKQCVTHFGSACLQPYVTSTQCTCAIFSSVALLDPRYLFYIFSETAKFSTKRYET